MFRRPAAYVILLLLFLAAAAIQARSSLETIRSLAHREEIPRAPFRLEADGRTIDQLMPEARAAGLTRGDVLVRVDGLAPGGRITVQRRVLASSAGSTLEVAYRPGRAEGSGNEIETGVALRPAHAGPATATHWVREVARSIVMPAFCMLLGFWVAAVRVEDRLAWLLLALMLGYQGLFLGEAHLWADAFLRITGLVFGGIFQNTWPMWMFLFGLYFPDRLELDRRHPWMKWLLLAPLGVMGLAALVADLGASEAGMAAGRLREALESLTVPHRILQMLAIGTFFAALGYRQGTTRDADSRRRLKLLLYGSCAGLLPMWILAMRALVRGGGLLDGVPLWVATPTFLLAFLAPLSLAYVIVVHKALDVRVVIRQGVQYAFARRGVFVLQFLISVSIVISIALLVSRPEIRRPEIVRVVGLGVLGIMLMRPLGARLVLWTDRRFFRDAYDAERILTDLSEKVRGVVLTDELLATVASRLGESLHVEKIAIFLESDGGYEVAFASEGLDSSGARLPASAATVRKLAAQREPLRIHLDDPHSWINRMEEPEAPERDLLRRLDCQLLLPMTIQQRLPGFISLGGKRSEEPYSGIDLRLLRSVSAQTALALEHSRLTEAVAREAAQRERLNREVEIAREVQQRLFPQNMPAVVGLDYAGRGKPALGVGGDYYDFIPMPGGELGVAVGDVSGKGIGAALLMASLQASLRGRAVRPDGNLSRLFEDVNRLVHEASPDNRYATLFFGCYHPGTRELVYVNGGHNAPLLLRHDGREATLRRLDATGTVVGLFDGAGYREDSIRLEPGDLLIGFSDGISEALDTDEQEWGEERLIETARQCAGLDARGTLEAIFAAAEDFTRGADQYDDMTLVVMRVS